MKRLTEYTIPETGFSVVSEEKYKRIMMEEKPSLEKVYNRLKKIEDILGDEYDLDLVQKLIQAYREGRYIILKEPEQAGISRLRELAQADREGRCVVLETDRKKLEIAFNIVVKYGFCQDCRWVFEDKNCLECGCYQDGAKIIKEALFGGEAALRGEQDE